MKTGHHHRGEYGEGLHHHAGVAIDHEHQEAGVIVVFCPRCQGADVGLIEDVPVSRSILTILPGSTQAGLDAKTTIVADGAIEQTWLEAGGGDRLHCRNCAHDWPLPEGWIIEWR